MENVNQNQEEIINELYSTIEQLVIERSNLDLKLHEANETLFSLIQLNDELKNQIKELTKENENMIKDYEELEKQVEEMKKLTVVGMKTVELLKLVNEGFKEK